VTKCEVTGRLTQKLGVSLSQAEQMLEAVGEVFRKVLLAGGKIRLQGFGTFGTRTHPQRKVKNEKNKKWYVTERNQGPYFKPSRELKKLAQSAHPAVIDQPRPRQSAPRAYSAVMNQPASHRPLEYFEDVSLSATEHKVASYLHRRLGNAPWDGVCLTDERIAKATGLGVRQIATVRKSLEEKNLIRSDTVPERGTRYTMRLGNDTDSKERGEVTVSAPKGAYPDYGTRMSDLAEKLGRWR